MRNGTDNREAWKNRAPFSADQAEKDEFFRQEMEHLTEHHRRSCQAYDDICIGLGSGQEDGESGFGGPYLPVALFKDLQLRSVPEDEVVRQVTSSGTTGQQVSRIYLDAATAELQRWALCSITGDFIGGKRLPMLIIDSPDVLRDRRKFSARGAGILGFSMMSSKRFYALDEQMRPDWASIEAFCELAKAGPSFAFGFTFMIWQYLYQALEKEGRTLDLHGCYLIHGGGWKKLQDQKVSDEEFRERLRQRCGFGQISDYYGMAEQTGSIFMQCEHGHLHASVFSDIEILDPEDFTPCETGKWGLIALRSWIPTSYPGHMLLTEDRGRILGVDDCPCGRKGKYFEVSGRISKAEIRGCSDTFEEKQNRAADAELQILAGQWPPETAAADCFDPLAVSFLEELSALFMKDPEYRQFPDIYALGFWLRPAHLQQLKKRQQQIWNGMDPAAAEESLAVAQSGLGLVLHIAPSNMPAMFAYSWATALLAGNANAVRISGKSSVITDTILKGIRRILDEPGYERLKKSNVFLRFPRGHKTLEALSKVASARMIWGGDETVRRISEVPAAKGCRDIPFADKYSIALLDEDAIRDMTEDELRMQAHLFCRDTYGADQNACSSPRSVFWIRRGKEAEAEGEPAGDPANTANTAKQRWWNAVAEEAGRYALEPWMATEKYRMLCRGYAEHDQLGPVRTRGNRLYVVPCKETFQPLPEAKLGMFYEFDLRDLTELYPLLGPKIQTVVCAGIDPEGLIASVREAGCPGVDRAVRTGEALEFDTIWDRMDLLSMLTKEE